MADGARKPRVLSDRALEMVMRDVLDGMGDLALGTALRSGRGGCRILGIEPAGGEVPAAPAEVLDFARYKKAVGS